MRSPNRLFLLLAFLLWLPFVSAAQNSTAGDTTSYSDHDGNAEVPTAPDREPSNSEQNNNDDDYSSSSSYQRYRREAVPRNASAPTDEEWNAVTSGKDFPYKNEREFSPEDKPREPDPPSKPSAFFRAIADFFHFLSTTFGLVILFTILAIVIGLVIYYMITNGTGIARRNQLVKKQSLPDVLSEEDILLSNWEEKMRAAMASGDYRLAIRFGYLLMLQQLQRRNLIIYRQDKTNTDYYRELADTREAIRPGFRSLTRAYEYAWYSGVASSQSTAEAYFNTYNALKAGLQ